MVRLLQLRNSAGQRRVGVVDDERVLFLRDVDSTYSLAQRALSAGKTLTGLVGHLAAKPSISYDEVYEGGREWRILPAIDHPTEPARCLVSGTGLTHLKSAENRQAMHGKSAAPTDSMRIYDWGVQHGKPSDGEIGVSPEWFYKGTGTILRAHGEPLAVPPHAEDGGEEAEIAGIYIIDSSGAPRRIGMAAGNEFSDHVFEKKNFMYIAASKLMPCAIGPELIIDPDFRSVSGEVNIQREGKLMPCAIGPELIIDPDFRSVSGEVNIRRKGKLLWHRDIRSGEEAMCHSLANLEHHHFKHASHRQLGDIHVHFFGVDAFSFGEGVRLENGDVVEIGYSGFGRPLRNPVQVEKAERRRVAVTQL